MDTLLYEKGLTLLSMPNFPSLGEGRFLDSSDESLVKLQLAGNLQEINTHS
jgi:hypothetical protein